MGVCDNRDGYQVQNSYDFRNRDNEFAVQPADHGFILQIDEECLPGKAVAAHDFKCAQSETALRTPSTGDYAAFEQNRSIRRSGNPAGKLAGSGLATRQILARRRALDKVPGNIVERSVLAGST